MPPANAPSPSGARRTPCWARRRRWRWWWWWWWWCILDCRYSPQSIFNAKNFNLHKKPISLFNVPICTQGMQRTWWPEAIVTGPYLYMYNVTMNCHTSSFHIRIHVVDKRWNNINSMSDEFVTNKKNTPSEIETVGGSSSPRVETFSVSKTFTLSQEHPLVSRKWMLLPAHSWHFKR